MTTLEKIQIGAVGFGIFLLVEGFTFFASLISSSSDLRVGLGFAGMGLLIGVFVWMVDVVVEIIGHHIHKEKV